MENRSFDLLAFAGVFPRLFAGICFGHLSTSECPLRMKSPSSSKLVLLQLFAKSCNISTLIANKAPDIGAFQVYRSTLEW
jgi:hypothetical protein